MKKLLLVFGILSLLFLLAACAPGNAPNRPEEQTYFQGYDGVEMEWTDRDSPPRRLYYYSDDENRFDVSVEVWNRGSSAARGALYLSGYDPHLIDVPGINPSLSGFGACEIDLGNIGFGEFGASVVCDRGSVTVGGGGWGVSARDFGALLGEVFGMSNWDRDSLLGGADFEVTRSGDNTNAQLNLGNGNVDFDLEYGSRGRLMISLLSGIRFGPFGLEYLLAGDTPDYPGGDVAIVDWGNVNIENFPPGLDETEQTFLVTNCYMYTTHAAPVVCIDPAPFSEGEKVCRPSRYNPTSGQGAPVAVTSIEQENTPRQALFTIHVQNRGDGEVWDPGSLEKCNPYQGTRVTSGDKNKVWLGQVRVSGDATWLECTPDDYIRLDKDTDRGYVTCRYDIPFQGLNSAYQTPLVVELWYGYEETLRKTVTIKRAI